MNRICLGCGTVAVEFDDPFEFEEFKFRRNKGAVLELIPENALSIAITVVRLMFTKCAFREPEERHSIWSTKSSCI
jgi:hypothetical protein